MPLSTRYAPGDYNVSCDRTGFKMKASECQKEWTGRIIRKKSWDPRHPQDFIEVSTDDQAVPDARPWPTDKFLSVNEVTVDDL